MDFEQFLNQIDKEQWAKNYVGEQVLSDIDALKENVTQLSDTVSTVSKMEGPKGESGESIVGPVGPIGPKGDKGDRGERGADGKTPIAGVDFPLPKDGADGAPGRDGVGIPGKDGKDGSPDTPDQVVEKVNLSSKQITQDRIEGLADIKRMASFNPTIGVSFKDLENTNNRVTTVIRGTSETLTYNPDGTLALLQDGNGTKSFTYNGDGTLQKISGTGAYGTKTFTYSSGLLTSVTVQ